MVFKHEWRMNVKSLLIWTVCVAGLDFVMLLMYPSMKDTMSSVRDAYKNMGSLSAAFGMDRLNLAEPIGFYGTYVGAILALGGGMFAAILGTSILSKEEGGHTAEFLFTLPYPRQKIMIQKLAAIFSVILVFNAINLVAGLLAFPLIGEHVSISKILIYHVGQLLMHLEIASMGVMVSAFTKKVNLGVGLGIALFMYFADMMSRVLDQLKFCKYFTPYYYSNASDVLVDGKLDAGLVFIGMVLLLLCLIGAGVYYQKKDLAV